ncbi:hypothetical protein QTI33_12045 [Variovorax sp. J22P271]|nr:hypothetical protein [Variovorax sp. J22P271]
MHWLAAFISISSATGILLAMLGYGVALSAQEKFGIPYATVFSSTSDLFSLGGWAIVQGLAQLDRLMTLGFYADLWRLVSPITLRVLSLVAGISLVGGILLLAGRWIARFVARQSWWRMWTNNAGAAIHRSSPIARVVAFLFAAIWTLVGTPVLLTLGVVLIVVVCTALAVVPMIGMEAGKSHIDAWVVRPTICFPLIKRQDRLDVRPAIEGARPSKIPAASCVAIAKANGQEIRGRVVFSTFNAIVLYDPVSGAVRRVPTNDGTVEVVGSL